MSVNDAREAVKNRGTRKKKDDTVKKEDPEAQTKKHGKKHFSIYREPLVKLDMENLVPAGNLFPLLPSYTVILIHYLQEYFQ